MYFVLRLLLAAVPVGARTELAPVVTVLIPPVGPPMDHVFYSGRAITERIFSETGVRIEWRLAGPHSPGCLKKPMHQTILLAFSWNTAEHFHAGALAFSNPYSTAGACVTVFMDRLKPMAAHNPVTAAFLLGHILAHEMAHVLQGIMRHSESGVLKEGWSPMEVDAMRKKPLRFTDYDKKLILEGLCRPM